MSDGPWPWCRLWNELLSDAKLRLIATELNKTYADVLGLWIQMMIFANNTENRGMMYWGKGRVVTATNLAATSGWEEEEIKQTWGIMTELGMIGRPDPPITLCNWRWRQFRSDGSSTKRVRNHRRRANLVKLGEVLQEMKGDSDGK